MPVKASTRWRNAGSWRVDFRDFQGQFGRGTGDVGFENFLVERVRNRDFVAAVEECLGMVNDILVQGIVLRQQDDGRFPAASPDAAAALPGGHHRSRIADQDAQVQAADVDPHFESAGGDDRGKLPACQFLFD